ncbi:MAG TPA: hypothetical protein ENN91_05480 [Firmicutes bacterium]|nr:hypothetical protein [Bacillota bacterium]
MEYINREELEMLVKDSSREPSVSLYMTTQKGRERARENAIRFKNLLAEAEKRLDSWEMNSSDKEQLLDPAKKLLDSSHYWANQGEGFACFLNPGFYRFYRLPLPFTELAVVKESFHLKPLFSLLTMDGRFYVLAISRKDARLLRATKTFCEEVDLSTLVEKFEAAFDDELPESNLQFHTRAPYAGGTRTAVFFGHGGDIESIQKERLLQYFRFIDRELPRYMDTADGPLVLACVDYLAPLYREASSYPSLMEEIIRGNPENRNNQEIHQKAWAIVKPYFEKPVQDIKNRYLELKGTGKTSNDVQELVKAAHRGRISDLLFVPGIQQWGRFNPQTGEAIPESKAIPGSNDLIDFIVTRTFLNKGGIYALESEEMPDSSPAAALFRW